jgi:hypothetical protein
MLYTAFWLPPGGTLRFGFPQAVHCVLAFPKHHLGAHRPAQGRTGGRATGSDRVRKRVAAARASDPRQKWAPSPPHVKQRMVKGALPRSLKKPRPNAKCIGHLALYAERVKAPLLDVISRFFPHCYAGRFSRVANPPATVQSTVKTHVYLGFPGRGVDFDKVSLGWTSGGPSLKWGMCTNKTLREPLRAARQPGAFCCAHSFGM